MNDTNEAAISNRTLLDSLTEKQRHQVLVEFNRTETDYPRDKTVHGLFEEQTRLHPTAIALSSGDRQVTYRDLNRRANRLARHLRGLGVSRQTPVAVLLDRSFEAVESFLAILKAGGAYVPIEPSYPAERLELILDDAKPPVLLTSREYASSASRYSGAVVLLDEVPMEISDEHDRDAENVSSAEDLCYVMYTSGSTGQPKGARIVHRGVVRLVRNTDYLEIASNDVFFQFASLSFDASTLEVWAPLLNGARLEVPPPGLLSLHEMARHVRAAGVTILWLTAGLFHQMVDYSVDQISGLRRLLVGGDVISPQHARKFLENNNRCRLINGYGPTENTTFTCCYPMDLPGDVGATVSIGRPIANTQVYVLDENLQPVPVGAPGELYIGGDGLARDYLNDEELTSQKFIPNPFKNDSNARLYRSGDLVCWRPDGTLDFLGRLDGQVKLRGFRVEPGEIEETIRRHDRVSDSAVVVEGPSPKRLVAFYTPLPGNSVESRVVREYLVQRLPQFMIPALIAPIDQLPLTPNGKVDRRMLLEMVPTLKANGVAYEAPTTEVEQTLATIWREILGVERVGRNDTFLALGGDSLGAMEAQLRIQRRMQARVSPHTLLGNKSLAQLAEVCEEAQGEPDNLTIPRAKIEGPLGLSSPQRGLWFNDQLFPGSRAYNILLGYRIRGALDVAALTSCFQAVVDRHEILRTTFFSGPDGPAQEVHERLEFRFEQTDLSGRTVDQRKTARERWLSKIVEQDFDLTRLPLIRAHLLRVSEDEHELILAVHHIVFDGWSEGVLFSELGERYRSLSEGESSETTVLPVQFADYAAWQRASLSSEAVKSDIAYWKRRLEDAPPLLRLPYDRPRPDRQTFPGKTIFHHLPGTLVDRIREKSQEEGATLFMGLLAAMNLVLRQQSGQDDVVIGSPIANRDHADVKGMIGYFVNMLALRTDLSGGPTYREVIQRTRATMLEAYSHREAPFESVAAALGRTRNLGYSNIFQVAVAYHNASAGSLDLPGLRVSRMELDGRTSKFDLSLSVIDSGSGLDLWWEYSTDLFDPSTVEEMLRRFIKFAEAIADKTDSLIEGGPEINGQRVVTEPKSGSLATAPAADADTVSPTEEKLQAIWRKLLDNDRVGLHESFFLVGGDSLLTTALASEIETSFGRVIPIAELYGASTIAGQAKLIESAPSTDNDTRLIRLSSKANKTAIVLLPSGDGKPFVYSELVKHAGDCPSIYAVQLRYGIGGEGRVTMEQLADECVRVVRESELKEPYHLAGFSFGGMLTYEVARKLQQGGACVGVVGIIDTGPYHQSDRSLVVLGRRLFAISHNFPYWLHWNLVKREQRTKRILRKLSEYARRVSAALTFRPYSLKPEDVWDMKNKTDEQRAALKANLQAFVDYTPGPYSGRITLFRARVRPLLVSHEHDLGWSRIDVGGIKIHDLPSNHDSIIRDTGHDLAVKLVDEVAQYKYV